MGLMFKKKPKKIWDKPFNEKVARRVSKIPNHELLLWAEQSLSEINRCISAYQRNGEDFYMHEALLGAEALHAVINEYRNRVMV